MAPGINIEVLGCHGGEMAGYTSPCLLLDGRVLLDAGSFGSALTLRRQLRIEHVLLSHAHCDHVKDLPALADLAIGKLRRPICVHASAGAMDTLRRHLFNNQLWPDFFALPGPSHPVLRPCVFRPGRWFRVGHLRVKAVPVIHPVESMALLVRGAGGSFVYTGDTGPCQELWREARRLHDLRLVLAETKFPSRLQAVADAAGHLTPSTLAGEMMKLGSRPVPILLYHLKPEYLEEIRREVRQLGDRRFRLMRRGERLKV